jgi:hypothetical protein
MKRLVAIASTIVGGLLLAGCNGVALPPINLSIDKPQPPVAVVQYVPAPAYPQYQPQPEPYRPYRPYYRPDYYDQRSYDWRRHHDRWAHDRYR